VDYEQTKGEHPIIFKEVRLEYHVEGEVEPEKLIKAVTLSQTKYCGVTAMISKTSPVYYKIYLNSEMIGEDQASFN
jgi:putative redox protein